MRRLFAVLACTTISAACADNNSLLEPEVSQTILVNGNDPTGPGCPPDPSCLAPIDAQIKILYERNNALSEPGDGTIDLQFHGEADYRAASSANKNLATIWLTFEMTASDAITWLNRYIADVERGVNQGTYSECAGAELVTYATWIRGLVEQSVAAGAFDPAWLASAPTEKCVLSPVGVTAVSSTAGVTLNIADIWGFQSYYEIARDGVVLGTSTTTSFLDATAVAGVSYVYDVRQCSTVVGCGAWTSITVVAGAPTPLCVHDNRNGGFIPPRGEKKCKKP